MKRKFYHLLNNNQLESGDLIMMEELARAQFEINGSPDSIPFDKRCLQTLFVFDGLLLEGGLPKSAKVVRNDFVESFLVRSFDLRKKPEYPYQDILMKAPLLMQKVYRYFILLPSCSAVMVRFCPNSLSPQYLFVKVKNGVVSFETSSY